MLALAPEVKNSEPVRIGQRAPLDRSLWTCPCGAADFRYRDGTCLEIERSTVVALHEETGARHVNLESGVLFVRNYPPEGETRKVVVHTPHAAAHVAGGEAAVVPAPRHARFSSGLREQTAPLLRHISVRQVRSNCAPSERFLSAVWRTLERWAWAAALLQGPCAGRKPKPLAS